MRMTPRVGITAKKPKRKLLNVVRLSSRSHQSLKIIYGAQLENLNGYISRKYPQSKQLFISLVTPQIVQCSLAG